MSFRHLAWPGAAARFFGRPVSVCVCWAALRSVPIYCDEKVLIPERLVRSACESTESRR